jgi:hypothetical protein
MKALLRRKTKPPTPLKVGPFRVWTNEGMDGDDYSQVSIDYEIEDGTYVPLCGADNYYASTQHSETNPDDKHYATINIWAGRDDLRQGIHVNVQTGEIDGGWTEY